ncbi:VOC family protein [Tsukamurella sp. 8F]|uniref:VOC family protein n=1 Tax=unclassified Tsukamurella TaxID=2633480 RepID=UPI0023B97FFA|nr:MULTISPECIES: VOC family protein [unclassified Tsukamurella]MDF0532315.1 VOC family protein [Tsukamurella sp. 8J]MDF0589425.1 VOC family protein [Tsukamurella sp. 8F]
MTYLPDSARVARIVVSVADLERALGLYRDVLGLSLTHQAGELAFLQAGDIQVMLHERAVDGGDAAVAVTFAVPALDGAVDAWVERGGAVVDPPALQPWGERQAVVRDADRHILCLIEARPATASQASVNQA